MVVTTLILVVGFSILSMSTFRLNSWMGQLTAIVIVSALIIDLVFLPAPDFGNGNTIGAASWQFGISGSSESPDGARAFIEFALQDQYLAAFSDALGLAPATLAAAEMTENYKSGGPLEVFFSLSEAYYYEYFEKPNHS